MDVKYAETETGAIAYRTFGDGPRDLVLVPGWVSHLDYMATHPLVEKVAKRLASFSRLILFDKRGTGLSDQYSDIPDLETRMDDVRAVMDAAGSKEAALLGISEGAPMSILFAATYPERTTHLVLYGAMARSTATQDYPWAPHPEAISMNLLNIREYWGQGLSIEVFSPTLGDDESFRQWWVGFERTAASPRAISQLVRMFGDIDVRAILPSVRVPTLIVHRKGDRVANYRGARWMAEQIPGAKYVELPGVDHLLFAPGSDAILDPVEEFITGSRREAVLDRVLATCMFTDIVGSTEKAALFGDADWGTILAAHQDMVRSRLQQFGGKEIKTTGDGFLVTFDGPTRAVSCAKAISRDSRLEGNEIRAGLHTGEIEFRRGDAGEQDVAGIGVHIAARVMALAGASEVLVSSTVKDLVAGSGLEFDDRGAHELKGVPGQWRLFAAH